MSKIKLYKLIRFFFGIFIVWLGIVGLNDIKTHETLVIKSVEKYDTIIREVELTFLSQYLPNKLNINLNNIKNFSNEILLFKNILLIAGGLLCSFGFSISKTLIIIGFIIDLIFIHNIFYWVEERMKVNVLKYISILGGVLHIY